MTMKDIAKMKTEKIPIQLPLYGATISDFSFSCDISPSIAFLFLMASSLTFACKGRMQGTRVVLG